MTFTESFRMERVYFEKLKNNITDIRNLLAAGNTEDARILLENSVDVDGAVLLLYRNLGECWAELADQIKKTRDELDALKEATEAYHDELNEKIDNVNFVLLRLINALDARLTIVENDLATMPRVKFLSLVYDETESAYSIQDADGETVSFEDVSEMAEFPHFIVLTDEDGNYYMPEEYTDSGFLWHIDNYNTTVDAYSDISVLLASDDSVTVSESTLPKLSEGYGININSDNEIEVDTSVIQEKLVAGSGISIDPDTNEISNTSQGASYVAGAGIDIDSNNEISVDTTVIQEKLTAGNNISITNNVISATDTTYSEGTGIDIDSNNVISADTTVLQEKLVAGSGIAIDPNTNEISNTAQGSTYTAGKGITLENNTIINDNSQIKDGNTSTLFFPSYSSSISPSIYYGGRLALFAKSSNLIVPTNAIYTYLEIRMAQAFPTGTTYPSYTTTLPDGEYTFAMWFSVYAQQNYVAPFVKTKSVTFKVKVTSAIAEIIGIPYIGYGSLSDILDDENISGVVASLKKANSRITLTRQTNFAIYSDNAVLTNSNLTYDPLISSLVEFYRASIM